MCTKHPNWPSWAHPGAHRRTQARTVAVSWPLARPCRGQGWPCGRPQAAVSQPARAPLLRSPATRPALSACAVSWLGSRPCRGLAPGRVAGCVAVAQALHARLDFVSRACLMIQSHAPSSFLVTIQILYRDQASVYPPVSLSQYSRVYCDTLCPNHQALQSRYKWCIVTQFSSLPLAIQ